MRHIVAGHIEAADMAAVHTIAVLAGIHKIVEAVHTTVVVVELRRVVGAAHMS